MSPSQAAMRMPHAPFVAPKAHADPALKVRPHWTSRYDTLRGCLMAASLGISAM
jgi:hypothetical protein